MINDALCNDWKKKASFQNDMNETLKQWAEEHDVNLPGTKTDDMPVEGTCKICTVRPAAYRCINCGKNACISCFWVMLGTCKECVTEEQLKKIKEHHF